MNSIAPMLAEEEVTVNEIKTIQRTINETPRNNLNVRYLGTLHDIETGIDWRKNLAYMDFDNHRHLHSEIYHFASQWHFSVYVASKPGLQHFWSVGHITNLRHQAGLSIANN